MQVLLSLLMVLCIGCQLLLPPTCANCGSAAGDASTEQRFPFFTEAGVPPGTYTSPTITRTGRNLVVEAFPIGSTPGVATAAVLDAPLGGSPTLSSDAASPGPPLSGYTKWMVRGVLQTVALHVVVTSGNWAFFGTFTDEASSVARTAYYDRNTKLVAASSLALFTPHLLSVQWTYTCPAGRKMQIASSYVNLTRNTAPGVSGLASAVILYTPAGGGTPTNLAVAQLLNGNVGANNGMTLPGGQIMNPGDAISGQTIDNSTTGDIWYATGVNGTEYDL
jgi:hypothetical protein